MKKPYWYKLLDAWVNDLDNSGLSIPFLIGVDREYVHHFPVGTEPISALLKEIVQGSALELCVTLEYCGTIEAYRFGLAARADVKEPHFVNAHGEPTLAYRRSEFGNRNLNEVISLMKELYAQNIEAGRFSRDPSAFGAWGSFSGGDKKFIAETLKIEITS